VRVGIEEQAGVEVRVRGLVLNGREEKVRNVELLNIQNAIFGKEEETEILPKKVVQTSESGNRKWNSKFGVWKHLTKR